MQTLTARDINRALKRLAGSEITAKDFRTFSASVQALALLREGGVDPAESSDHACKREVNSVMKAVAEHLVNTPAVTRSSYVPELLVTQFMEKGIDVRLFCGRRVAGFSTAETALVRFLRKTCTLLVTVTSGFTKRRRRPRRSRRPRRHRET